MPHDAIKQTFTAALDALVEQIRTDRSILAAILCGSLSHDTVWAKSDIDLVLVTVDDKKVDAVGRVAERRRRQRARVPDAAGRVPQDGRGRAHNSFMHSLLAKGRLLYTHDDTIADLCERLREIGERDIAGAAAAAPRPTRCRPSTRRTSGSSRAAISTTPRCGFSTPRRRWRRSR